MTERPTRYSPEVRLAAATTFAPNFIQWADGNRFGDQRPTDVRLDEVINTVLLRLPERERDAYRLAREIDRIGYSANHELVDLMDEWDSHISAMTMEAIGKWVIDHNIKPHLHVGDTVTVKADEVNHEGVIQAIHEERAEYVVSIPSLGHVSTGEGIQGIVVAFERLHLGAPRTMTPG